MSDQPPRPGPEPREPAPRPDAGVNLSGDEVNVGGDVAGRDVVKTTQHISQTTTVGFSEKAVRNLILTVGVLVFVTAACFFSGGVVVGVATFNSLNRPVTSAEDKAAVFQDKLTLLQSLAPGQTVNFTLEEDELSSYVRFILGPQIGFAPGTGKARLLEDGRIAVAGRVPAMGNVLVGATFTLSDEPGQPLALDSAVAQVVPLPEDQFGFGAVPLPAAALQPAEAQLNSLLSNVQVVQVVDAAGDPNAPVWNLRIVTR